MSWGKESVLQIRVIFVPDPKPNPKSFYYNRRELYKKNFFKIDFKKIIIPLRFLKIKKDSLIAKNCNWCNCKLYFFKKFWFEVEDYKPFIGKSFRKKNDICCQFIARYKEITCMDNLKIHLDKFVRNMSTVWHLQGRCRSGVVTVGTAVDDTGHLLVVELAEIAGGGTHSAAHDVQQLGGSRAPLQSMCSIISSISQCPYC